MSESTATRELRMRARADGIRCTEGLLLDDGRRINRDDTTTLWCADGRGCVVFEEDAGELYCADPLTPEQALALFALVGGRRHGIDA